VITFVLGGARSGKSVVAEDLVARLGTPVTYVATVVVGDDDDLAARVEAHRRRRPPSWRTVEIAAPGALAESLRAAPAAVLVDSLGPWVATCGADDAETGALCDALTQRPGDTVVVSEEVGLSVHPSTEAGRRFRDALGTVNQAVAACADSVLFVVAGRVLPLVDVRTLPGSLEGGL